MDITFVSGKAREPGERELHALAFDYCMVMVQNPNPKQSETKLICKCKSKLISKCKGKQPHTK